MLPGDLSEAEQISSAQLDHLLKLSALPRPKDEAARRGMIRDLSDQMHFVKKVQDVDTTGVEPLRNITAEQDTSELTYEEAMTYEKSLESSDDDYTTLASKIRKRYYTVSGGLVNDKKE